jgi:hypothetical protein
VPIKQAGGLYSLFVSHSLPLACYTVLLVFQGTMSLCCLSPALWRIFCACNVCWGPCTSACFMLIPKQPDQPLALYVSQYELLSLVCCAVSHHLCWEAG